MVNSLASPWVESFKSVREPSNFGRGTLLRKRKTTLFIFPVVVNNPNKAKPLYALVFHNFSKQVCLRLLMQLQHDFCNNAPIIISRRKIKLSTKPTVGLKFRRGMKCDPTSLLPKALQREADWWNEGDESRIRARPYVHSSLVTGVLHTVRISCVVCVGV